MFTPKKSLPKYLQNLTSLELAYLAGFLDGDGSLHTKIIKRKDYKIGFQISIYLSLHQHKKHFWFLQKIHQQLGQKGSLRIRNNSMGDLIITGDSIIKDILTILYPYLQIKQPVALLILKLIKAKQYLSTPPGGIERYFFEEYQNIKSENPSYDLSVEHAYFIEVCKITDKIAELNYSKNRKWTSQEVKNTFLKQIIK